MGEKRQRGARALVIGGFGTVVLSGVVNLIDVYSSGIYKYLRFSGDLVQFLIPLATMATITAWWFMSQLTTDQLEQRLLLQRAYRWFGVEYLVMFATAGALGWHSTAFAWTNVVAWIQGAGEGLTAIGFLLMARSVGTEVAGLEGVVTSGPAL